MARSVTEGSRLALVHPPDLLISDLGLTDGNDCELLARLRAIRPHIRAIAVSGSVGSEYERRCAEAGYERLLPKPLVFELMVAAICGARPRASLGGVPAPPQ